MSRCSSSVLQNCECDGVALSMLVNKKPKNAETLTLLHVKHKFVFDLLTRKFIEKQK